MDTEEFERIADFAMKAKRRGTMVADGVMWCPNCGSETVSNGHVKCSVCDRDRPVSAEEFRKIAAENLAKSEQSQAERGGKDWVDEVALEEAMLREVDSDGDEEEDEEEGEEEHVDEVAETPEIPGDDK